MAVELTPEAKEAILVLKSKLAELSEISAKNENDNKFDRWHMTTIEILKHYLPKTQYCLRFMNIDFWSSGRWDTKNNPFGNACLDAEACLKGAIEHVEIFGLEKPQSIAPVKRKSKWSRGEKWTAAGVIVAVLAAIAAIVASYFVPEVRRKLGLEKPVSTIESKPTVNASPSAPEIPHQELSAPPTPTTSTSKTAKPKTAPAPNIKQHSEGPNSPNIVGSGNQVTINPEPNPYAPVVTYDFNGARRETSPGKNVVNAGEEFAEFQQMRTLFSKQDWKALADLCEVEIAKVPAWLTPYLYAGVAYVNLGQKDKAIERLGYVERHAGGNPEYKDAARILKELK